jgi:hypothetical protein
MFSHEVTGNGAHTHYYEAEQQKLTPPARRFFDGYCNDFQCVRINAESPAEKAGDGVVTIDTSGAVAGDYLVWGLVKGDGAWQTAGKTVAVNSGDWKWVKLADAFQAGKGSKLRISSRDDGLKLDTVMITTEGFVPVAADPRDSTPPKPVENLKAQVKSDAGGVLLTWDECKDVDFHHYSVYCGSDRDFVCDNATVIRSVYKNSITDAGMPSGKGLYYKVVAYDGRWNASEPAVVEIGALAESAPGEGSSAAR